MSIVEFLSIMWIFLLYSFETLVLKELFASFSRRERISGPDWSRKISMYLSDKDFIEQWKIAFMKNQFSVIVQCEHNVVKVCT